MSTRYIPIVLVFAILHSCSSREELPPPDNPFDPGNPNYVNPAVEIIGGPIEGEIVEETTVTFEWQGNESATEYRYQLDGSSWSEWSVGTSVELDYLDEGLHIFEVKANSLNGDEQEVATQLNFKIDAVAGPSGIVYPYLHSGSRGDTIIFHIVAEEAAELFAVHCRVRYDSNLLELIEVFDGTLKNEWGGIVLCIQDVDEPIIDLSMVPVENTNQSFSGTASVLSVKLRIKTNAPSTSETTALTIEQIELLNPQLEVLTASSKRSGILHVW